MTATALVKKTTKVLNWRSNSNPEYIPSGEKVEVEGIPVTDGYITIKHNGSFKMVKYADLEIIEVHEE